MNDIRKVPRSLVTAPATGSRHRGWARPAWPDRSGGPLLGREGCSCHPVRACGPPVRHLRADWALLLRSPSSTTTPGPPLPATTAAGWPSKTIRPRVNTSTRSHATATSSTTWVEKSTIRSFARRESRLRKRTRSPRIEADRGLVDDDNRRQPEQGPRHGDALPHAARVGRRSARPPARRDRPPAAGSRCGRPARKTSIW